MESFSTRGEEGELVRDRVAEVCAALGARAAGYWRLDPEADRLLQVVFIPGVGLDPEAGREFAAATRVVSLHQQGLGIVVAATAGRPAVSRVEELPARSGSGRWLRAFGASRSVAVPIRDERGPVRGVLSVALPEDNPLADEAVAGRLLQAL
jgi:hypothetical protein